jgi:streptogramin lyase
MGSVVGPDRSGEKDTVYLNFMQNAGRLFLLAVDPETGKAEQYYSPQDSGGWATVLGPDKKIYIGTFGHGLLLRFDPAKPDEGIQVVGRPAPTESYIWQLVLGKDGKLYGCTYPQARLVSYDPASGAMEDLGRMSETEMYARSVAVGADGRVYVGIGMVKPDLVMYDPATREHRSAIPKQWSEIRGVSVIQGAAGKVYAHISHRNPATGIMVSRLYRVEGGELTPDDRPEYPVQKFRNGRVLSTVDISSEKGQLVILDPQTRQTSSVGFKYEGEGCGIFMVGAGPEGCVYGSTAMPLEVFRHDPRSNKSEHLGNMPGGEVYSMVERQGKLYLCYYGGSVMNLYDPKNPTWNWGTSPDCNPRSFGSLGDGHLRPRAMIYGPDGLIYIGSHPPYGQLGGAMAVWDPAQNKVIENYRNLVKNQSIAALAYEPESGLVFGGSGNYGGGGTSPSEKEAMFFAFDPRKKEKVFETALVPGAQTYQAMVAARGRVFVAVGSTLYAFDPQSRGVVRETALPGGQVEISLGLHTDGQLYGLCSAGVYTVNPETHERKLLARSPVPVNCGFALTDTGIYFGSGANLWRYVWE